MVRSPEQLSIHFEVIEDESAHVVLRVFADESLLYEQDMKWRDLEILDLRSVSDMIVTINSFPPEFIASLPPGVCLALHADVGNLRFSTRLKEFKDRVRGRRQALFFDLTGEGSAQMWEIDRVNLNEKCRLFSEGLTATSNRLFEQKF